jgi:hypothetical protein
MQRPVKNVGTVINWMEGTRKLIQDDDPRFKAAAMSDAKFTSETEWQTLKTQLLADLQKAIDNAKQHAHDTVNKNGSLDAEPFLPQDKFTAVFQSALDEHLSDRVSSFAEAVASGVKPPFGPPEKFDGGDAGWMIVLAARLQQAMSGKATFVHHADFSSFRYEMPETTSVVLFGDWATGEAPALALKSAIEKTAPEYTIHLGDTYYAGFRNEISHNLVANWPGGVKYQKDFAMNGNHEMYCGGKPYFGSIAVFGQSASYFNIGNKYYRIIGLDTSWCERDGPTPASSWGELAQIQLPWLDAQIRAAQAEFSGVRIILLTHHQLFSAFDGDDLGQFLLNQLHSHIEAKDFFAWFWGHEHRGIVYADNSTFNFKARCIGHGGFPYAPCTDVPSHLNKFPISWREERCEPDNAWYGMRGFAKLTFAGPSVSVEYIDQENQVQFTEKW